MEWKIGETIAALRRQRGMTQEALASAVGVSAAAVSKWETGASCPDVALLSPLARALRTDVNAILDFTAQPSEKECAAYVNEVAELALSGDADAARTRIEALLREYPDCPALQYQLAALLMGLPMWAGGAEDAADRARAKALLSAAAEGDDLRYAVQAAHMLAGLCAGDGELERAEALLDGLPSPAPDTAMLQTLIAEKRGETERAKRILQTELLRAFNTAQTCLMRLANTPFAEPEEALMVIRALEACAEAMGFPYSMRTRSMRKPTSARRFPACSGTPVAPCALPCRAAGMGRFSAVLAAWEGSGPAWPARLPPCGRGSPPRWSRRIPSPRCGGRRNTRRRSRCCGRSRRRPEPPRSTLASPFRAMLQY